MAVENPTQSHAIIYAINLGKILQNSHPDILIKSFEDGRGHKSIAETLMREGLDVQSIAVVEHAVGYALRGTEQYVGLFDKERYVKLAKEHRAQSGARIGAYNAANNVGCIRVSREELSRNGIKGAIAKGQIPYTDTETNLISLYKAQGMSPLRIAAEINESFHDGENIRTRHAVSSLLRRIRTQ